MLLVCLHVMAGTNDMHHLEAATSHFIVVFIKKTTTMGKLPSQLPSTLISWATWRLPIAHHALLKKSFPPERSRGPEGLLAIPHRMPLAMIQRPQMIHNWECCVGHCQPRNSDRIPRHGPGPRIAGPFGFPTAPDGCVGGWGVCSEHDSGGPGAGQ